MHGSLSARELVEKIDAARSTLNKTLKALVDARQIIKTVAGRSTRYRLRDCRRGLPADEAEASSGCHFVGDSFRSYDAWQSVKRAKAPRKPGATARGSTEKKILGKTDRKQFKKLIFDPEPLPQKHWFCKFMTPVSLTAGVGYHLRNKGNSLQTISAAAAENLNCSPG